MAAVPGPAAPAPKYGVRYTMGVKYRKWIDNDITVGEVCPFGPSQLRISDLQSCTICTDEECGEPYDSDSSSESQSRTPESEPIADPGKPGDPPQGSYKNAWLHIEKMLKAFEVTLPFGADQEAQKDLPAHRVVKYDPFESAIEPRQREGRMEDLRAASMGIANDKDPYSNPFMTVLAAWEGIVTKGTIIISNVKRYPGQAYMHEVTNAIYSHLVPEDELKYIFVKNIRNTDTRGFIQYQIYGNPNGVHFPPTIDDPAFPNPNHFPHGTAEYDALLGTEIGKMIARFVLGRYPHGSCRITKISLALSGEDDAIMKYVDMMFELQQTKEPFGLLVTPYPSTSSSEEPEEGIGNGGGLGGPAPGVALDPAAQQAQNRLYNRYRETMAIKRDAERQDAENEERYGRTRSGKQRKKE
ncbi:hypothetical protein N7540_004001 [Penicillium herquei]|nr:hypothetical protein N7540_004001 [Penicillium herquei]